MEIGVFYSQTCILSGVSAKKKLWNWSREYELLSWGGQIRILLKYKYYNNT